MMLAPEPAINVPREFRAAWVATVDNIDWPSKRGLTVAQQKAELAKIVDVAAKLHLNALIFQVRPHADAMYPSKLEPWSIYLSGTPEVGPSPAYDPLKTMIDLCHARGIELHAWFNPYRAWHPAAKANPGPNSVANTHPGDVRDYGGYKWMDPSSKFVQQRSIDVMKDVISRYDVDGVHIDDYFYPYPVKDAAGGLQDFPDQANYDAYVAGGGKLDRGDWRRKQVDDFVQHLYGEIKKTRRTVKFGISPFGIYRPGYPAGIKAGVDQYAQLYADCLKWFHEGWCDYFTPQLYWPDAQTPQSYSVLLKYWSGENKAKRHLWPGNYTGQLGLASNWATGEILNQINITRRLGAGGNAHFSMKVFLDDAKGIDQILTEGPYKNRALIPASPWLAGAPPSSPKAIKATKSASGQVSITASCSANDAKCNVVTVAKSGGEYQILDVSPVEGGQIRVKVWPGAQFDVQSMHVALMDRAGQLGPWLPVRVR